ncbi:hypothetical protein GCM10010272_65580 [Streptomyces lateritius]|nr:hypothetical protein GCM10010272_65580 [Streptomyces lateritius]
MYEYWPCFVLSNETMLATGQPLQVTALASVLLALAEVAVREAIPSIAAIAATSDRNLTNPPFRSCRVHVNDFMRVGTRSTSRDRKNQPSHGAGARKKGCPVLASPPIMRWDAHAAG